MVGVNLDLNEVPKQANFKPGDTYRDVETNIDYLCVKLNASAVAAAANGTVLYSLLTDPYEVTDDVSVAGVNQVAGVGRGVITVGYVGWIVSWGAHSAIKKEIGDSANVIATGDMMQGSNTADGLAGHTALDTAPTNRTIGPATDAATLNATTVPGVVMISKARS